MANTWHRLKWLRVTLAVVAAVLLAPLLAMQLALLEARGSVLKADYLADRLEDAELYDFVTESVIPAAVNDLRVLQFGQEGDVFQGNPLVALEVANDDLAAWAVAMLPRDWFEATTRESAIEVWAYLSAGSDGFAVTLRPGVDDDVIASESVALLRKSGVYDYLANTRLTPLLADALAAEALPFANVPRTARLETAVRRVLPREWFDEQSLAIIYEVAPYLTGRADGFRIHVELYDRARLALEEFKLLLDESGSYDALYEAIVEAVSEAAVGEGVVFAPGVTIYAEDVSAAIRESGDREWARGEVNGWIDEVSAYLLGDADSFEFVMSFEPVSGEVTSRLEDVAHRRAIAAGSGRADVIIGQVAQYVVGPLTQEVKFTDQSLRDGLETQDLERLDQAREIVRDGFSYTEADAREDIRERADDPEAVLAAIDKLRSVFTDGHTYTDADLRRSGNIVGDYDALEVRYLFSQVRMMLWIAPVLVLIALAVVTLLPPGRWHTRLAWGSGAVAGGALATCALFTAIYFATGASYEASRADAALVDAGSDFAYAQATLNPWLLDLGRDVVGGFTSGLAIKAAILAALALVALAAALWWRLARTQR